MKRRNGKDAEANCIKMMKEIGGITNQLTAAVPAFSY